jgi:hypothetical protein
MTGASGPAAALVLALLASPTPTPRPTPRPAEPDADEKRVEHPVQFVEPSPQMRKLAPLVGTWSFTERWTAPERYKRGVYEGEPGPGGSGTLTVSLGPGGFSLVVDSDGTNPMGHVTSRRILAWDSDRRLYELDEIHSAFPGVLHLTGRFEEGDLVFRGTDARTGAPRSVRLVWKGLGQDAWTANASEAPQGGRFEPVVTAAFTRLSPR